MNKTKLLEGVPSWKILAISCFFLMFFAPVSGQVVISPTPIVGLQFSSTDVLNFSVINTSSQVLQVTYSAQLMDGRGRAVVRYASGVHQLSPGASSYTPTSFNVVSTSWVNRTIQSIEQTSKFLPSGDYTYCIDIHCASSDKACNDIIKPELDYVACSDVRSEPISPLLLSLPEDEAKLKDKRPNFSWIPPMPLGSNPNMRYTLKLVEMREHQSAEDAIRRNRPLHEKNGINGLTLMYPNQLEDLKVGTHYAWQVSAHIGEQHIATSDVWEFEIKEEIENLVFHALLAEPTGYVIKWPIDQTLNLQYESNYKLLSSEKVTVSISNGTTSNTLPSDDVRDILRFGSNTIHLDLQQTDFNVGEVLTIQATDTYGNQKSIVVQLSEPKNEE